MKLFAFFVSAVLVFSLSACGRQAGGGFAVVEEEFSDCLLCKAAKEGDLDKTELLLAVGANPNAVSSNINANPEHKEIVGDFPLRFAVFAKRADIVRMLLEGGANPNQANKDGATPLTAATTAEIANILLDAGANPDTTTTNKEGGTALMFAAYHGQLEIVKVLLDNGANPNMAAKDGWTALNIAANNGQGAVAKVLLECGASPDQRNNEGINAWHWANQQPVMNAIFRRHLEEVKAGKVIKPCPH